ncbi:MAG: archaetidylserine decarboxylase [Burkholderiaceae bacterium]
MTLRTMLRRLALNEDLNFLLTNRLPRQMATRFIGWFAGIEQPLVRDLSLAVWRLFTDLDLSDARTTRFRSLHDCFTRALRDGARPVDPDPDVLVSPCDAIVGAYGPVRDLQALQAKGFAYPLVDLLGTEALADAHRDGWYVTLRLTSAMYHRFHAPLDWDVDEVTYISGDTWNVNPIALRRIERLFCKNERVVVTGKVAGDSPLRGARLTLVPVAAILVASVRLHFLDVLLHLRYRGPNVIACKASFSRGDEMGWFEHGSTIIVFAPAGFIPCATLRDGCAIRMGQPLLRRGEYRVCTGKNA